MQNKPNHSASSKNRFYSGFTLVELLVVIVIIAVLATLTASMSRKMTQKAQRVNAISSIRQIGAATLSYSAENNGELNRVMDAGESKLIKGSTWVSGTFWGRLTPYMFPGIEFSSEGQLAARIKERLPAYFNAKDIVTMKGTSLFGSKIYGDSSGIRLPFAFNSKTYKWNELKKVQAFNDPVRTVYFTYGFYHFNKTDAQVAVTMPITNPGSQSNIYWFEDKTAPFIFLDGHMEVLRAPLSDERFE